MNYRTLLFILSMLLLQAPVRAADVEPKQSTDSTLRTTVINLYELLKTLEDDADRIDALDRDDTDDLKEVIESRRQEVLEKLEKYKGYEGLAQFARKHRFNDKADYSVAEVAGYTLLAVGVIILALTSINVNNRTLGIPSTQNAEENLTLLKGFFEQLYAQVFPTAPVATAAPAPAA